MKRTFKALLLLVSLFFVSAFSAIDMRAQNNLKPKLEGTWVLDSVQVISDKIVERTVLPGDDYDFAHYWIWQFTLGANDIASYTKKDGNIISNVPYHIIDTGDNSTKFIIDHSPSYNVYTIQLHSNNKILTAKFLHTIFELQDSNLSWNLYYSKSN